MFQGKGVAQSVLQQPRGPIPHTQGVLTSGQLQNITFHAPHSATQLSANPNSMLPTQIHIKNATGGSLQPGKPVSVSVSGGVNVNKLGMQPMSITLPFVTGGGELGGQQHAVFLSSGGDDGQKAASLHLQTPDLNAHTNTHPSPSNPLIS